jgi:ribokinase
LSVGSAAESAGTRRPRIAVVGSINLDLVVACSKLPRSGETIIATEVRRIPGGKGANQALACTRMGADVTLIAAVGRDDVATEALANLTGLSLRLQWTDTHTGMAVIFVDEEGEDVITVLPGANEKLTDINLPDVDAVLCQLEIPDSAIRLAYEARAGLFCLNASPVHGALPVAPDLTIVNEYEFRSLGALKGDVAVTYGARGAALFRNGEEVAQAEPPAVSVRDGTAAGDAFAACLLVSILEGRPEAEAVRRACAAGALAASKLGAQTSLPYADEVDALLG